MLNKIEISEYTMGICKSHSYMGNFLYDLDANLPSLLPSIQGLDSSLCFFQYSLSHDVLCI